MDVIPVLPVAYRLVDDGLGADLTTAYGNLYAANARLARMTELGVPEFVVANERKATARA